MSVLGAEPSRRELALAPPFVRRVSTLLVAVPLAAMAGLAVFGVVALLLAALFATAASAGSAGWSHSLEDLLPGGWPRRRRRK